MALIQVLPKLVKDLADKSDSQFREAMQKLREPGVTEVKMTTFDGQEIVIREVHPK